MLRDTLDILVGTRASVWRAHAFRRKSRRERWSADGAELVGAFLGRRRARTRTQMVRASRYTWARGWPRSGPSFRSERRQLRYIRNGLQRAPETVRARARRRRHDPKRRRAYVHPSGPMLRGRRRGDRHAGMSSQTNTRAHDAARHTRARAARASRALLLDRGHHLFHALESARKHSPRHSYKKKVATCFGLRLAQDQPERPSAKRCQESRCAAFCRVLRRNKRCTGTGVSCAGRSR